MPSHPWIHGLPSLSVRSADAHVELEAAALLAGVRHVLSLETIPLPVPIDTWIETPLGYDFSIVGDDDLPLGALGLARPARREILIHQSLVLQEGRYRFTCAHELGHCILHRDVAGDLSDADLPRGDAASKVEHEADRFAAAVLMPLETISGQVTRVLREHGVGEGCVDLLRGDDVRTVWLWRRCLLPALGATYSVSRAAAGYRVRELRLPGGRRLLRPSLVPLLVAPEQAVADLPLDRVRIKDGVIVIDG